MNIFRGFLSLVIALILFAVSFGQDCENGQCARQSRPVMRSIVNGSFSVVRSTVPVVRQVATAPRRFFAERPIRKLVARLRCR